MLPQCSGQQPVNHMTEAAGSLFLWTERKRIQIPLKKIETPIIDFFFEIDKILSSYPGKSQLQLAENIPTLKI